jgi:hypothetical protein
VPTFEGRYTKRTLDKMSRNRIFTETLKYMKPGSTIEAGYSGTQDVLTYDDILDGALGSGESELFALHGDRMQRSAIPHDRIERSLMKLEPAPRCYDTRVFMTDGDGAEEEDEMDIVRVQDEAPAAVPVISAKEEEKISDDIKEDVLKLDERSGDEKPTSHKSQEEEVAVGKKRKGRSPEPVEEKQTSARSKATFASKSNSKKKFTLEELPSSKWKAYRILLDGNEERMVYQSPEGIACYSAEMMKSVHQNTSKPFRNFEGVMKRVARHVKRVALDSNLAKELDDKHLAEDAVVLYRIRYARMKNFG